MSIMTFKGAVANDPRILEWKAEHQGELGSIAAHWFAIIRTQGDDVAELLHDGYPTACVDIYPFAYVGVFKAHINVGFFHGSELPDPTQLLQGSGKRMRHVKIKADGKVQAPALEALIRAAYADVQQRIASIFPAS